MNGSAEQLNGKLGMHSPISREGGVPDSCPKGKDPMCQEDRGLKVTGLGWTSDFDTFVLCSFTSLSLSFLIYETGITSSAF